MYSTHQPHPLSVGGYFDSILPPENLEWESCALEVCNDLLLVSFLLYDLDAESGEVVVVWNWKTTERLLVNVDFAYPSPRD